MSEVVTHRRSRRRAPSGGASPSFRRPSWRISAVVAALFAEGRQLRGVERARITFEIAPDLAQWGTEITEMIRKAGDVGRQLIEIISLHARGAFRSDYIRAGQAR